MQRPYLREMVREAIESLGVATHDEIVSYVLEKYPGTHVGSVLAHI